MLSDPSAPGALRRGCRADAAFTLLAIAAGMPSLLYPLGRDQGLFFYIGREWLQRGRMPYLDTFDIKTPGIYGVHAAAIALFGEELWGARLLELLCAIVLGWLAATLAVPVDTRPRPGARGATAFVVMLLHYGFFDFWNSGQCEIWCVTAVIASAVAGTRLRPRPWAHVASGALFGVALVFKTPAAAFAPVVLAYLGVQAFSGGGERWRRSVVAGATWTAGVAGVVGAVIAYFAARGALAAMYELLVVNMRSYVLQGRWVHSVGDVVRSYVHAASYPWPYLVAGAWVTATCVAQAAKRRADIEGAWRALAPPAFLLAAVVAVTMQLKFAWYHWGLVVGAGALCAGAAIDAIARKELRPRAGWWSSAAVAGACAVMLPMSRDAGTTPQLGYLASVRDAALRASGRLSPEEYLKKFDYSTGYAFSAPFSYEIGNWLRANTAPEDTVAVRSMEPQIYAVARRHHTGRFFWTTFLEYGQWAYRMQDWVEEDRRVFIDTPPTFVVAGAYLHQGPISVEYFVPLGYVPVKSFGGWVVLRHARADAPEPRSSN